MKPKDDGHRFLVSFDENSFGEADLFPDIKRTRRMKVGSKGLSGGKLEIRGDGIRWRAGSIATPRAEISGYFFLSWEAIARVDIGDVPNTIKALGGALTILLSQGRGKLYGEFLGSRTKILAAFSSTPLGVGTEVADEEVVADVQAIPTVDSVSMPPFGTLSEDGERFWNGTAWVSAKSADGQMFWTGDHWSEQS